MKKILAFSLAVLMLFSAAFMTGCKEKTSINAEGFKSAMEAKGFAVADASEQFADVNEITCVYIALLGEGDHQIEFYELDSDDSARRLFAGNKNIFEQSITGNHAESSVSLANYDKYTLTNNGAFMLLSRIDNTLVYVNSPSEYKDEINSILKEIGY